MKTQYVFSEQVHGFGAEFQNSAPEVFELGKNLRQNLAFFTHIRRKKPLLRWFNLAQRSGTLRQCFFSLFALNSLRQVRELSEYAY